MSLADWTISEPRWPVPWTATHRDYDASWDGEEAGWVDNGLTCSAQSREALLVEIAEIEAEHLHFEKDRS